MVRRETKHGSHDPQVAVHCHAGLGRTGVLLACYLVYYLRYLHSTYLAVPILLDARCGLTDRFDIL